MSKSYIPVTLRQLVYERADGICEYCQIPEIISFAKHQIDHIIAEKHEGGTVPGNLALACVLCNKHKGSDIASIDPETGKLVSLFNPRQDLWKQHFKREQNGIVKSLTDVGRTTVQLLQFNSTERISERVILSELQDVGIREDS